MTLPMIIALAVTVLMIILIMVDKLPFGAPPLLALLLLAGRAVSRMRADRAERAARALAPAFTLLLFAVHLLMGLSLIHI